MNDLPILVLILAPAALGLFALVAGIVLWTGMRDSNQEGSRSDLVLKLLAGFCFLVAFGIGACYAVAFMS